MHLQGEVEAALDRAQEVGQGAHVGGGLGQAGEAGELEQVVDEVRVAGDELAGPGEAQEGDPGPRQRGSQGPQRRGGAQEVAEARQGAHDHDLARRADLAADPRTQVRLPRGEHELR
ncbi:hypothetical protein OV079_16375 [Nannocystis pusilla]|uniref:Uncharacterized protein n=1 Tax=Nannocystis pusilla TaxID=889268 RepID=A0A9X3EN75_9BACT|nr:hypothetical protein [Nannocystis pusilla]MCY1007102.1 hypothetical protein [Nannocystis pusilla]